LLRLITELNNTVAGLEGELLVCRQQSGRPTPLFWLLVGMVVLSTCLTILRIIFLYCKANTSFPIDR